MATTTKPPRPVRCLRCGSAKLTYAGAGYSRTVRGKRRRATHVRCPNCKHEWTSIAKAALAAADAVDRAAPLLGAPAEPLGNGGVSSPREVRVHAARECPSTARLNQGRCTI